MKNTEILWVRSNSINTYVNGLDHVNTNEDFDN